MSGYFSLVLHAHLPFVRHPEHEKFLEENWLFEAITETYVPLLQVLESWLRDGIPASITLTLSPTLCSMLLDPLLQDRYERHLEDLIDLADKEVHRLTWEKPFQDLALYYHRRFCSIRDYYQGWNRNLVAAFRRLQEAGRIEIITCSATHALLPLMMHHPDSVRAQLQVARDHYRSCFGHDPKGIWLPECAYAEGLEYALEEANLRWFVLEAQGILHAHPRPRYAMFAPILTKNRIAAFGRDPQSARQVWSRDAGYPGDPRYRDFYRDIGFDLDFEYIKPFLPAIDTRAFTGIKYFRITGTSGTKQVYRREEAMRACEEHANHFLEARIAQIERLSRILDRPPILLAPYDAELFGHWWYEGPEFLDAFARRACAGQNVFRMITPGNYLELYPTHQLATPSASSWGEDGHWKVWLNEKTQWIHPHLNAAQERMTEIARRFSRPSPLEDRALKQAARELLLAQASDWPFIMRSGTSPEYAQKRVKEHLLRFTALYEQLIHSNVDEVRLGEFEAQDNIFPEVNWRYWMS